MWFKIMLVSLLVLSLVGCVTPRRKQVNYQSQQSQDRIALLEKQLQEKDEELRDLESELERAHLAKDYPTMKTPRQESKVDISKVTPKQIQTALKNAGFYDGPVDGKIAEKTKKAIKEFQKANGLAVDGCLGRKTWLKLSKYLKQRPT